jgi:hypothetical protein
MSQIAAKAEEPQQLPLVVVHSMDQGEVLLQEWVA